MVARANVGKHLAVTWFEDMQRHRHAGEQHDGQRKERQFADVLYFVQSFTHKGKADAVNLFEAENRILLGHYRRRVARSQQHFVADCAPAAPSPNL